MSQADFKPPANLAPDAVEAEVYASFNVKAGLAQMLKVPTSLSFRQGEPFFVNVIGLMLY
jgi:hypothetical protein